MTIGGVSGFYNPYTVTSASASGVGSKAVAGTAGAGYRDAAAVSGRTDLRGTASGAAEQGKGIDDEHKAKGARKSSIAPQASASTVMTHEKQHVANAYQKAAEKNGEVVSCSVSLHTAVCPECGTTYVAGGTTNTSISYPNESNPYQKDKKAQDAIRFTGANIDYVA